MGSIQSKIGICRKWQALHAFIALCFWVLATTIQPLSSSNPLSEESVLWSPTLNYSYYGETISEFGSNYSSAANDSWHRQRVNLLDQAFNVLNGPNIALARLSIIYKTPTKSQFSITSYDIPNFFISGWDQTRLGKNAEQIIIALNQLGKRHSTALGIEYHDPLFIKTSYPNQITDRVNYAEHLLDIYETNHKLSRIESVSKVERIRGKPQELKDYLPFLRSTASAGQVDEFAYRFYDSEQALYLKLESLFAPGKIPFADLVKQIPENAEIRQFVLNIASYYDMCFDCSDTGFRLSEARRSFSDTLATSFFECSANYYVESLSPTFLAFSGCESTDWPKSGWHSRGPSTNFKDTYEEGACLLKKTELISTEHYLASEKFPPYVAIMKQEW